MAFPERKQLIDDLANRVFALIAKRERGQVLYTEEIETTTGQARYTVHWNSIIKRLKRMMEEKRGITLWPVVTVGYKLCTPGEQLHEVTTARQKRAVRQLNRSLRSLDALPTTELSDHQQYVRAMKSQHMIGSRRAIKRQIRRQAEEAKRDENNTRTPQIGEFARRRKANGQEEKAADGQHRPD